MAFTIDSIKDKKMHERPPVIQGWELRYPKNIDELFWGEWLSTPMHRFRPLQMRLTAIDSFVYTRKSLDELTSTLRELWSVTPTDIDKLCKQYTDKVSHIKAVNEVLVVEEEQITTIWTIINSPPFEDSLREPIYEAQSHILRSLRQDIPLDFYVLNEAELTPDQKLSDIIPANSIRIWRR